MFKSVSNQDVWSYWSCDSNLLLVRHTWRLFPAIYIHDAPGLKQSFLTLNDYTWWNRALVTPGLKAMNLSSILLICVNKYVLLDELFCDHEWIFHARNGHKEALMHVKTNKFILPNCTAGTTHGLASTCILNWENEILHPPTYTWKISKGIRVKVDIHNREETSVLQVPLGIGGKWEEYLRHVLPSFA